MEYAEIVFRVGIRDAELLAPEFRPMEPGALSDQEPFTAWQRQGIARNRIFVEDELYSPRGSAEAIRHQSRQRAPRSRGNADSGSDYPACWPHYQVSLWPFA